MNRFRMLLSVLFCAVVALGCCNGAVGPTAPGRVVGDVSTPDRDVIPDEEPAEFGFGGGAWEWETRGIGGGGAFLAASINPHDPNDFSISTDMGMNFRSVDFGRSWFGMHFQTLRGSDRATLRWTADPQQVYTIDQRGWDGAFLIRSIDAGRSWDRVPTDPTDSNAHWVHVDPTSTERVLVASRSEVFFSSDGGATWQTVYSAPEPEHGVYVAGVSWAGDTIVVGISDVMIVSVDGGGSWQPLEYSGLPEGEVVGSLTGATAGETRRIWVVSRASGSVWPGIRGDQYEAYSGVWRMDMGPDALFTQVATDLPREFFPFTVAAAQFDISRVFLGGGDRGTSMPDVYRSDDGGEAWTATFGVRRNVNIATGWCGHRGDVDYWWSGAPLTFEVSPTDSDILIMGDYGFVHVSADGGDTWRQAYVAEADQNPPGQSTPKGRAYRGIGIEDTSSWWLHWTDQSTMFAAYSDIRGISSDDAGERWSSGFSAGLPHNSTYHVVSHGPSGRLYGATSSVHDLYQSTHLADERIDVGEGHIVFSEDGGGTWDQVSDMGHPVVWLSLDPTSENRLYASVVHSNEGGIYVTDDITASSVVWTRLPSPVRTEGHPFNVRVLRDGTIVTTWSGRQNSSGQFTDSSGVFVSEDGGATWSDRSHADMRLWTKDIVIDPHDVTESTWYVSVFSHWGRAPNEIGGIFRTSDRGETWHRISDLYRVESVSIDPNDADLMYVATEANGLWQSRNARSEGPGFVQVLTYPFEHPTRVFFNPFDPSEVWSTSFGGGLRVLSREELGVRL